MADATSTLTQIGTAHVLIGAFSADGAALKALGEQATVTVDAGSGQVAYARTPSGFKSAKNAVEYGRVPNLQLELDEVAREVLGLMYSGVQVDAQGNVYLTAGARKLDTVSAVVIPSRNIDASGQVIDPSDVFWLPFLAGEGNLSFGFNNSRGENANSPINTQLMGLTDDEYNGTPIEEKVRSLYYGDIADTATGWKLPAPYTAAV